jgi:outer membrane protein assembly factor BamD (BamD/ComL family)
MVQAYGAMGMPDLQKDTQRILDLNVAKDGIKPVVREMPQTAPWWNFWS